MNTSLNTSTPVLLLGGMANTLSVTRSLGKAGIKIFVVANKGCVAHHSRYCHKSFQMPGNLSEELYYHQILFGDIQNIPHGCIILPCDDIAINFIAENFAALREFYCLDHASPEQQKAMLDKQQTLILAEKAGCSAPKLWKIETMADVESVIDGVQFPVLIKPVHTYLFESQFGVKLLYIEDKNQLFKKVKEVFSAELTFMLCEYIPGPDTLLSSCYTYIDAQGNELFCFTKRIIRRSPKNFGGATLHATQWLPETARKGMQFFRGIGFQGLGNVEFKTDPRDGKLKIIECNARFTAAQELVYCSGVDIAELIYRSLTYQSWEKVTSYRQNLFLWDPYADFFAYLGLKKTGEITLYNWIVSVLNKTVFSYLSLHDPIPFLKVFYRKVRIVNRTLKNKILPRD